MVRPHHRQHSTAGSDDDASSLAARIARLKIDLANAGSTSTLDLGTDLPLPTLDDNVSVPILGSSGTNFTLPWANLLSTQLAAADILIKTADVSKYCKISAVQSGIYLVDDNDLQSTPLKSLQSMPVGERIDLTALLPGTSGLLYGGGTDTSIPALALLPPDSTIGVNWDVKYTTFVSQNDDSRALKNLVSSLASTSKGYGIGLGETSCAFQLLSDNLTAPLLSLVPWPEPAPSSTTPNQVFDYSRLFCVSLQLSFWWPGSAAPVPYSLPLKAYFVVSPWSTIIPDFSQPANYIPSYGSLAPGFTNANSPTTNLLPSLNNTFTASIDSVAPTLGKAATLSVLPTDKGSSLPGPVKQLVTSTPQVKVQAALDLSAVVQGILGSVASLFSGSPAASTVTAAQISIDKVLSSVLSIPIALDINGSSLAKTVEPLAGLPLPNLSTLQSGLGSGGLVPINSLTASLYTDVNSLIVTSSLDKALKRTVTGLTASLLPIPQFADLLDFVRGTSNAQNIDITIALNAKIVLPGAVAPIDIFFDLGKISLQVPLIPVPQITVMARSSMITGTANITDLLVSVDPETLQYLPNVAFLLQALQTLDQALATILGLFNSGVLAIADLDTSILPWSSIADLTSALNIVLPLLSKVGVARIAVAPFSFGSSPNWTPAHGDPHGPPTNSGYTTTIDLSSSLAPTWFKIGNTATDVSSNITSLAWIGRTRVSGQGWRMTATLDSWQNTNQLVLPSLNPSTGKQVCAAILDESVPASDVFWESWPDGTQSRSLDGWNGHVALLNWIYDQGIPFAPLQTRKVVRLRYFKLRNTADRIILRKIWSDSSYNNQLLEDTPSIVKGDAHWTDLKTETNGKVIDNTKYYFGGAIVGAVGQALLDGDTDYYADFSSQLEVTFEFSVDSLLHSYITDVSHELRS